MINEIRIRNNDIIFNNVIIGNPINLKKINSILNKSPSRIVQRNNTILVYDDEGIYLYGKKMEFDEISQMDIQLEKQDWLNFTPYSIYTGKFYIEDNEVKILDDIMSINESINTDELEGEGSLNITLDRIYISVGINLETKALQNISIWYL